MKILFVLVNPTDHPCFDVDKIWDQIELALGFADQGVSFKRLEDATSSSVSRSLQAEDWDVVHFVTTTEEREGAFSSIALLSADGKRRYCPAPHLAKVIAARNSIKMIVLQVCGQANDKAHVAEALADAGVETVVYCPLFSSSDQRGFLTRVYSGLAETQSAPEIGKKLAGLRLAGTIQIHGKDICPPIRIAPAIKEDTGPSTYETPKQIDSLANGVVLSRDLDSERLPGPVEYDVFLCHNSRDKPLVQDIADGLVRMGLVPWFDARNMEAGDFQDQLEDGIANSKVGVICMGPFEIDRWQKFEMSLILNAHVEKKMIVIPIWLSNVPRTAEPNIPPRLRILHWLDFRVPSPSPIETLAKLIRNAIDRQARRAV